MCLLVNTHDFLLWVEGDRVLPIATADPVFSKYGVKRIW